MSSYRREFRSKSNRLVPSVGHRDKGLKDLLPPPRRPYVGANRIAAPRESAASATVFGAAFLPSTKPRGHPPNSNSSSKTDAILFIIMRLNLKLVLLCLSMVVCIVMLTVYMRCSDFNLPRGLVPQWERQLYKARLDHYDEIDCIINHDHTNPIRCRRELDEVFVPFSFLRSYFEIYGTLTIDSNGVTRFNWSHSNAKVNQPKAKYDPRGLFMYFENYNVEVRDRVQCISASEGVPVSTQWEKKGYYYPTQIAQFGLSHYSKNLTEPEPRRKILEDGDSTLIEWRIPKDSNLSRIWHAKLNTTVMYFTTTSQYDSAIQIQLDHVLDLVLSVDLMLKTNSSSLMITLQNRETKRIFNIYYILANVRISVQSENIYYGIGTDALNQWKHLTRDLLVDVQKGLIGLERKVKMRRGELKIISISFLGVGAFDNLTLSTYEHLAHFYDAADWFVRHQHQKTGGWANPVKRNLSGFVELQAGWYSAMGQGHAISLLSRAYYHSGGEKRYLKAAANGLKLFRVPSKDGGVLAKFMGQYDWYEEYPTTPPSFVLNGFIYSLLGLYDLNNTAPMPIAKEAGKLFAQGMRSLKKMLPLYDVGSGTSYDLRHFTLGVAPNLARWDYHATHVNQLLLLATIDNDPLISQFAERWKAYMYGKRAKHN